MFGVSKEELEEVEDRATSTAERKVNMLKHDLKELKEEIEQLKTEIKGNMEEFDVVDNEIERLDRKLSRVDDKTVEICKEVDRLKQNINSQEADIKEVHKGLQERLTRSEVLNIVNKELSSVETLDLSEVFECLHQITEIRHSENHNVADHKDLVVKLSKNGLNQEEIATLLGTSRVTINRHLNK